MPRPPPTAGPGKAHRPDRFRAIPRSATGRGTCRVCASRSRGRLRVHVRSVVSVRSPRTPPRANIPIDNPRVRARLRQSAQTRRGGRPEPRFPARGRPVRATRIHGLAGPLNLRLGPCACPGVAVFCAPEPSGRSSQGSVRPLGWPREPCLPSAGWWKNRPRTAIPEAPAARGRPAGAHDGADSGAFGLISSDQAEAEALCFASRVDFGVLRPTAPLGFGWLLVAGPGWLQPVPIPRLLSFRHSSKVNFDSGSSG